MKILKFYADWCSPCKVLSNELKGFDTVDIESIDIDNIENAELVNKHAVRGLPTIVVVDENGEAIFKRLGVITKSQLNDIINKLKK